MVEPACRCRTRRRGSLRRPAVRTISPAAARARRGADLRREHHGGEFRGIAAVTRTARRSDLIPSFGRPVAEANETGTATPVRETRTLYPSLSSLASTPFTALAQPF